jgi:hypothetical protein
MTSTRQIILAHYPNFRFVRAAGANLSRVNCPGSVFTLLSLSKTDFSHSQLKWSNFSHSNAQNARFDYCDLTASNFAYATLFEASFVGADLRDANFNNAEITGANFKGARGVAVFKHVGSRDDTLLVIKHKDGLYFKTGCFWGTLSDFLYRIREDHGLNQYARQYFWCITKATLKLL